MGKTFVAFRPGRDHEAQVEALHRELVARGRFLHSQGRRTDDISQGCSFDQLVALLSQPPGSCPHLAVPHGRKRRRRCGLAKDRIITVPGTSHDASNDYIVTTCSDLHEAAGRPNDLWKISHFGHWADGAWRLLESFQYGSVHEGEIERQARLVRHRY